LNYNRKYQVNLIQIFTQKKVITNNGLLMTDVHNLAQLTDAEQDFCLFADSGKVAETV